MTQQPWDTVFKERGRYFNQPHEDIPAVVESLQERGAKTILDLGSGTGRHVIYFAERGFDVYGIDNAATGLQMTRDWLTEKSLTADLKLADITEPLPYADDFFDAVMSVQVIHHARLAIIQQVIGELERITKPGGLVFITVPTLKDQAENFEQIEPNTYIPLDGIEKGLPHYYFTEDELRACFLGFDVLDLHIDSLQHFCLLGERQG